MRSRPRRRIQKTIPEHVKTVRRIALAFPGVEEGPCYGTPGFRVRGKFLARMKEDGETAIAAYDEPRARSH